MVGNTVPTAWDPEQYWFKAKIYVDRAQEYGVDSPDYALWHAFALEHLARAALCSVHPVLNADPQQWQNLFYGVGVIRTEQPKSLPIHAVYGRLVHLLDDFTGNHKSFCGEMANRRNTELHSSELPFNGLKTQSWLARYYEIAEVLCAATNHSLEDLLDEETEGARTLIEASKGDGLGKVKARLAKHRAEFDQIPAEKQLALQYAAAAVSSAFPDTITKCPACESEGRLEGTWFKEGKPRYENASLVSDVTYLSNMFRCSVCRLELHGEEDILFAELPPTFSTTVSTSLHEIFEPEFENEYLNM